MSQPQRGKITSHVHTRAPHRPWIKNANHFSRQLCVFTSRPLARNELNGQLLVTSSHVWLEFQKTPTNGVKGPPLAVAYPIVVVVLCWRWWCLVCGNIYLIYCFPWCETNRTPQRADEQWEYVGTSVALGVFVFNLSASAAGKIKEEVGWSIIRSVSLAFGDGSSFFRWMDENDLIERHKDIVGLCTRWY